MDLKNNSKVTTKFKDNISSYTANNFAVDFAVNSAELEQMAAALRVLAADAVQKAASGHPGMPLGMADCMAVLYKYFINFNSNNPTWINRDRLVLSAGHGSMLLYATLYLTGYQAMPLEALKNFRQINSIAAGHPEICQRAGIEVTTGPLGHGLAMATGLAAATKKAATLFPKLINNKTYVIAGDGCLMEGISYEAMAVAAKLNLNNLIVIWDNNNITIDGNVAISSVEDQKKRFLANNFMVLEVDGHNYQEIYNALITAQTASRPVLIAAKTKIACCSPTKEGKNSSHGSPLGEEEIKGLKQNLNWNYPPFEIPADIKALWQEAAARGQKAYNAWDKIFKASAKKTAVEQFFAKTYNKEVLQEDITALATKIITEKPKKATRVSSLDALEVVVKDIPNLLGGAADLTASVMTKTTNSTVLNQDNYGGNYINYGIREHAMGAIMNGLAAYGGFIPYGGTFLVFSDFMRPSLRLAALQELQVIFVLTHDSIGVGEDGPTHQPVEHLASLRLIPGLEVLRPCDSIETLEAWQIAISNRNSPTALLLSRQNLPTLRSYFDYNNNLTALGGYILKLNINGKMVNTDGKSNAKERAKLTEINVLNNNITVNLIASGSEVALACEVSEILAENGIATKVISMPALKQFLKNPKTYIDSVIGKPKLNVIIEAATIGGYSNILQGKILEFGINEFGKSGKIEDVYKHFGLTTTNIVNKITQELQNG